MQNYSFRATEQLILWSSLNRQNSFFSLACYLLPFLLLLLSLKQNILYILYDGGEMGIGWGEREKGRDEEQGLVCKRKKFLNKKISMCFWLLSRYVDHFFIFLKSCTYFCLYLTLSCYCFNRHRWVVIYAIFTNV